ncbi:MAG: FTR1 family protein [Anaerolineales bacterium]
MLASFFLALREGLEAALIISLLLGSLRKMGRQADSRSIWLGTAAAFLLSLLVGLLFQVLGASFSSPGEEIFEGTTMLLAAGILTWMILWMGKGSRRLNERLNSDLKQAVVAGGGWALFSLAFLAVIREGVELALFLTAAAITAGGFQILWGAALGLVAVILASVLLFKGLIQLDLRRFFQVSSLILVLFAAGLVAHGVHEFTDLGWIPPLIEQVWDLNPILDENSTLGQLLQALLGYNGNPSLTEVLAYFLYLGSASALSVSFRRKKGIPELSSM